MLYVVLEVTTLSIMTPNYRAYLGATGARSESMERQHLTSVTDQSPSSSVDISVIHRCFIYRTDGFSTYLYRFLYVN
jgi:hypothetical protein